MNAEPESMKWAERHPAASVGLQMAWILIRLLLIFLCFAPGYQFIYQAF